MRSCAIAILATAMGCASLPPCPARGGPAWRELTSDHFVLRTDLSPREALETIRTLEDTRAAMLAGMWAGAAGPPGKSTAVALASLEETKRFTGTTFDGVHLRRPPFPATLVISPDPKQQDTAKHELAHELALYFLPVQPPWFAEGLATFLATIQYDRDKGLSALGKADVDRYRLFTTSGPVSLDQLMGPLPDDPLTVSRYYATTWLLAHYLYNRRGPGWHHLQDRFARLQPGTDAFRAEFPDLDAEGLQRTLMDYAKRGQGVVRTFSVAPWSGTPRIRTMTDGEVHGLRAFLYWSTRPVNPATTAADIRSEIDESLQAEAPALDALATAFYGRDIEYQRTPADLAALAVRAHPGHWMAWVMSADARTQHAPERESDLRRAFQLAPREPAVRARLAVLLAEADRWPDVLRITNQDLGAGATHPKLWLMHLAAARATGHCPEAELWGEALQAYLPRSFASNLKSIRAMPCPLPAGASGKIR